MEVGFQPAPRKEDTMLGFRKKEQRAAASVQTRPEESFRLGRGMPPGPGERALYRALRENVPIIDASI